MRWIFGLIVGLTLVGTAWAQQPAIVEQKSYEREAPAPEFAIPIRQIDDPEKEQRERETLEIQRSATVAAERATSASEEALKVARDALWWNWIQVIITGASVIGLIGTIWVGYGSIAAARAQNNIMQEQYIADQRPWLKARFENFGFNIGEQSFHAKLLVTNIGKSNALHPTFYSTVLTNQTADTAFDSASKFVDQCRAMKRDTSFTFSILPGSEKTHPAAEDIVMETHDPDNMFIAVYCIVYGDIFGHDGEYVSAGMYIFPDVRSSFFWVADNPNGCRGISHTSPVKMNEWVVA